MGDCDYQGAHTDECKAAWHRSRISQYSTTQAQSEQGNTERRVLYGQPISAQASAEGRASQDSLVEFEQDFDRSSYDFPANLAPFEVHGSNNTAHNGENDAEDTVGSGPAEAAVQQYALNSLMRDFGDPFAGARYRM